MVNPTQAKFAINQRSDDYSSLFAHTVGIWGYVIQPFMNSTGGKVLHFFPIDTVERNDARRKLVYKSMCGITNEYHNIIGSEDVYNTRKMQKCKRCIKKLNKLAEAM